MAPSLASRFGPMYGYFFMPSAPMSQVTSPSGLPPEIGLSSANFPFAHPAFTGHPFYSATNPYYSAQTSSFEQLQRFMRKDSTSPMTDSEETFSQKEYNPLTIQTDDYSSEPTDLRKTQTPTSDKEEEDFKSDASQTGIYLLLAVQRRYLYCGSLCCLLAHLSRRLTGELIGYPWIRRPSSSSASVVRRPSVHIFKHLLL